jgi:hypothetical protein
MSWHIETSILMAVLFMKTRPIDIKIILSEMWLLTILILSRKDDL